MPEHLVDRPMRCPECDHIVKYEDQYEAHCKGCGCLLRNVHLRPSDPFNPSRQCYKCWRLSSVDCDLVCTDTKTRTTTESGYRATVETKYFTCQSGAHTTTESRVISRELIPPEPPDPGDGFLRSATWCLGIGFGIAFYSPFIVAGFPRHLTHDACLCILGIQAVLMIIALIEISNAKGASRTRGIGNAHLIWAFLAACAEIGVAYFNLSSL